MEGFPMKLILLFLSLFLVAPVYAQTVVVGSGVESLAGDTTPQLGGDLDVNGNNITSAAGLDIAIGASAGNDFTVDTSKLVVEGDTGNMGIGTTTPLNYAGVGGMEISATDPVIRMNDSNGAADISNYEIRAIGAAGFEGLQFRTVNDANTVFSEMFFLKQNGDVGIGTTTPVSKLHVAGNVTILEDISTAPTLKIGTTGLSATPGGLVGALDFYNSDSDIPGLAGYVRTLAGSGFGVGGELTFGTQETYPTGILRERMRITSQGLVGIGTTTPTSKLNVAGGVKISTTSPTLALERVAGVLDGSLSIAASANDIITGSRAGDLILHSAPARGLVLSSNNLAEPDLFITPGASMGVGGMGRGGRFDVIDLPASSNPTIMLGGTTATTGVESASLSFIGGGIDHAGFSYVPVSGGDSKLHLAFGGNMNPGDNASKVTFLAGGNVGIGTTTPNAQLEISNPNDTDGAGGSTLRLTRADSSSVVGDPVGTIEFYSTDLDGPKTTAYIKSMSEENFGRKGSLAFGTSVTNNADAVEAARIDSFGNVGIGTSTPGAKLDVADTVFVGDSTTGTTIRRKNQLFATTKPGPISGGSIDMIFVDHTHSLNITVVAYIDDTNVATGKGYSVAAYGGGTAGLTQTAFGGVISALSISYVNSGGSESYILRVTTTYTGSTAPIISVTAQGQSNSKLRPAS